MSRLTDLIAKAKAKDADLGRELEREFRALSSRRAFGLNFERHRPENVELPGRPIRKGDKVRILPERGSTNKGDQRLWKVMGLAGKGGERVASLSLLYTEEPERAEAPVADLVVIAEFRDYIYPGLVSTGKVERGGDKPFHTVINGENFHALEALTFTHRGRIDAIYIDPPYNSRANDWKYNNNFVDPDDAYAHSKWLAMMERRLILARELLRPANSVLIVTIDEKEYLRLGLLLEQVFPDCSIQMVTSVIAPSGQPRGNQMSRVEEYLFVVFVGEMRVGKDFNSAEKLSSDEVSVTPVGWESLIRRGTDARRIDRENQFYPIFFNKASKKIVGIGDALLPPDKPITSVAVPAGQGVVWPIRTDGTEGRWRISATAARNRLKKGYLRIGKLNRKSGSHSVGYVLRSDIQRIETGEVEHRGTSKDGSAILVRKSKPLLSGGAPKTVWNKDSHNAGNYGSTLLRSILPGRSFPFPKSLYAVEDALRLFVGQNPYATVLDFFSGSGTNAHALMRLNKQDGGRRQCISVTNNEVSAGEQSYLRQSKLRPGDPNWEKWGICEYITKPRIRAAITGQTPDGETIDGSYKFIDEFPMADGFEENAEFFTLTYETPVAVSHNRAFERIAPLLWMRAGSEGSRIDTLPEDGWAVAGCYGLLTDLDQAAPFAEAIHGKDSIRIAYIVTDDERRFQSVVRQLPDTVEPVRLYESYLTNFRFSMGR